MIVVEEPPAFDALPAVDAPAPEIERLSATGVHTAPIEPFEPAAVGASPQPATPSVSRSVSISFERRAEPRSNDDGLQPPAPVPPGREPVAPVERQEMARVDAELLDQLSNISGEASIARSRLEQQLGSIDFNLGELSRTVTRLKEQLRKPRDRDRGADPAPSRRRGRPSQRVRSARARPLLLDPTVLARAGRDRERRREHPAAARESRSERRRPCCSSSRARSPSCRTVSCARAWCLSSVMCSDSRASCGKPHRTPASERSSLSRAPPASSTGRCWSACCRLSSTCCVMRSYTASRSPKSVSRAGKAEAGRIVLELHREGAEVMVRLTDDGGGMNLQGHPRQGPGPRPHRPGPGPER